MSEELNKAARNVCGQLSFVAAIILSCIGTQMLKVFFISKLTHLLKKLFQEYSVGAMIHLMGYLVAVFLVCQTGQKIADEVSILCSSCLLKFIICTCL